MKVAQIIHNPEAGSGQHNKKNLIDFVVDLGFKTRYASTRDPSWKRFPENIPDIIIVAGGDGTIRKLVEVLLNEVGLNKHIPLWILPLGTANNISKSLGIPFDHWPRINLGTPAAKLPLDCGQIIGLPHNNFFIESVGFGLFPQLIMEMRKIKTPKKLPASKLNFTLNILHKLVKESRAKPVKIKIGNEIITNSFLMVELMNIAHLGPNLRLAPAADPGDGLFDLLLVEEHQRELLHHFVEALLSNDGNKRYKEGLIKTLRTDLVQMQAENSFLHIDDSIAQDYKGQNLKISPYSQAVAILNLSSLHNPSLKRFSQERQ